ncbi:MAG: glycosyltransferase [Leptospiraceae bacterium]|nr:glycosyltransferase [Leptospiraceae bacterium]
MVVSKINFKKYLLGTVGRVEEEIFIPKNGNWIVSAVIGVPINSKSAYIISKFIKNQKEIQKYSKIECETVFATEERIFAEKLNELLKKYDGNFKIKEFDVFKSRIGKNRIWNIVSARNAIREYFLKTDADYLVFMDADMLFEPEIINKLLKISKKGYDVVYNGYLDRGNPKGINLTGFGGTLIKRWVMEKVKFKCKERNGRVIDEGVYFEFELVKIRAKVYRGFIAYSEHHDAEKPPSICYPRELTVWEKIRNNPKFRFCFHLISIPLNYDLLWHLSMKLKDR